MSTTLATDHPAWMMPPGLNGEALRVVEYKGVPWLAHWQGAGLVLRPLGTDHAEAPTISYTSAIMLPREREQDRLAQTLAQLGTVARLTTPDLWDSITSAIFHHFGRAKQGAALYRRWCATFGRSHDTFAGPLAMPPTAATVLHLSDQGFDAIRLRFYKPLLRAAARAYVDNAEEWVTLEPDRLLKALCEVRRLGAWTAAAAVADYTGDFSLYPHADRALRTRARRAQPDLDLPQDDAAFIALWRSWAPDRVELHTLTLFTLTWGAHAGTYS
ncbi:hypothetical protein ACWGCK_09625 [Streptomyces virginiae]